MLAKAIWSGSKRQRVILVEPEGFQFTENALVELLELEHIVSIRLLDSGLLEITPRADCLKKDASSIDKLTELGRWLMDALAAFAQVRGPMEVLWYINAKAQDSVDLRAWVAARGRD